MIYSLLLTTNKGIEWLNNRIGFKRTVALHSMIQLLPLAIALPVLLFYPFINQSLAPLTFVTAIAMFFVTSFIFEFYKTRYNELVVLNTSKGNTGYWFVKSAVLILLTSISYMLHLQLLDSKPDSTILFDIILFIPSLPVEALLALMNDKYYTFIFKMVSFLSIISFGGYLQGLYYRLDNANLEMQMNELDYESDYFKETE